MEGEREQTAVGRLGPAGEIKKDVARRISGITDDRDAARAFDDKGALRIIRGKYDLDRLLEKDTAEGRRSLVRVR